MFLKLVLYFTYSNNLIELRILLLPDPSRNSDSFNAIKTRNGKSLDKKSRKRQILSVEIFEMSGDAKSRLGDIDSSSGDVHFLFLRDILTRVTPGRY